MKLVILGAGESGVGAAILGKKKGYDVWVSEYGRIAPSYRALLDKYGVDYEEGGHTMEKILEADEVVKSPGISDAVPVVKAIREKQISVISEIELASRYTDAMMICISGSNGKTTTTSLIYHILTCAGWNVGLAGNIGKSLALQVAEDDKEAYVLELSSFQLEGMYDFRAHVGVMLNITPDHLDRYDYKMQGYVDAKMRLLQNMTAEDYWVYWADDEYVPKELGKYETPAQCLSFADVKKKGVAAYCEATDVCVEEECLLRWPIGEIGIVGRHNLRNVMASVLAVRALGVSEEVIRKALKEFKGVAHRLERVGICDGVEYVNDSKATNVDACYWALEAMKGRVVLLLGGLDKGNDYGQIMGLVQEKCRALVFLGADNTVLERAFGDAGIPMISTHSMKEAVKAAKEVAQRGDTVLLSPCCASFDLFKNMADRGEQFRCEVLADRRVGE